MERTVFFAKNINELLYQLKTTKDLSVVGGCTRIEKLPQKTVSIRLIPELCLISRHERYIDFGPGVTLNEILKLGEKHVPKVLYDAISTVANPNVRNLATIGGNICEPHRHLTLFAPLLALEAKLDIKNQNESKTISLQNFKEIPEGYILTNIRIPLIDGDVSIFKRVGPEHSINQSSASFAFIAGTEKNSITNIRMAFAGPFAFRNKDFETSLIGKRLPLTQKDIQEIMKTSNDLFSKASQDIMMTDVMRQQYLNMTRFAFEQLM